MHPSQPRPTSPGPLPDRLLEPQGPPAEAAIVPLGDPLRTRIARGLVLPGGPGRPSAEPWLRRSAVSGRDTDDRTAAA